MLEEKEKMDSFISWIGGKKLLRKQITAEFPQEYNRYVEMFGGAGWILFSVERPKILEVYNDINGDLVNLYRCVKYHPEAVQKELQGLLMSRELFFDPKEQLNIRGLTDVQKAARFYILIKESFGTDCRSFSVRGKDLQRGIEYITDISNRLKSVVIENIDFEHLVKTYDKESTLFYADPPYYNAEKYYPDRFNPDDHIRLLNALRNIKGKFILSYNDCSQIRNLYKEFNIKSVERQNNLVKKSSNEKYQELIIKNF